MTRPQKESKARGFPIHWIMGLIICITALIVLGGVIAVSLDIRRAQDWSNRNLTELTRAAQQTETLFSRQLPLRKLVEEQRRLVDRFAYEFDLFVAREEPDISALSTALSQMVDHYKRLEKNQGPDMPAAILSPLKANINMAIGIFEEASEFNRVGFGELYRLAEDSKGAVHSLLTAMNQLEDILDQVFIEASDQVNQSVVSTADTAHTMATALENISERNQWILWTILITTIYSQVLLFSLLKKRLSDFSRLIQQISGHSDLSQRIPSSPRDDLGKLATSFNEMLTTLEQTTMSRSYLDNIIESMDDAVLVLSPDGAIEKANTHACLLTGKPGTDLLNTSLTHLFMPPAPDLTKTIFSGELSGSQEYSLMTETGPMDALVSIAPLMASSDHVRTDKKICIIRDIRQLKKMEKEKIQAEKIALEKSKYALIGQIAGKMAHDFNNVLGIIMGNAELALMECQDTELKETLELIYDQTERGKNLTRNLVTFAKNQDPSQEFFHITETIDLVIQLLRKDLAGIELIRKDSSGLPKLYADPGMLEHALVNLVQNSIHALAQTLKPRIQIHTYPREDHLCLEIKDNGCGIPAPHLDQIYEPGFTLKGSRDTIQAYTTGIKGTGYGLSNVKKYVDQHQGNISIESDPARGTRFTICLPLTRGKSKSESNPVEPPLSPCYRKRILLVEDEQAIFDVQYHLLTRPPFQHQVDIAGTAHEAISLYEKNPYDCISLDYILKGKSNGMDVYTHIRQENQKIPILFVSGNIEFLESINTLKQEDPRMAHLSKPCRGQIYLDAIDRLMNKNSD